MKIAMLTTAHQALDVRILKEAVALKQAGYEVTIIGPHPEATEVKGVRILPLTKWNRRSDRIFSAWHCFKAALSVQADAYQFHDPELLPIGWALKRVTGRIVIYDCHEYLELDIRSHKPWIPRPFRLPLSKLFGSLEMAVAKRIDAVVSVLEDMTARFHSVNQASVTVHNYASAISLEHVPKPDVTGELIVYLGLLTPNRGLHTIIACMKELALKRPTAVCYVVGTVHGLETYSTADLPNNIVFTGPLAYDQALGYLKYAKIAWLPWQRTDYNELGLPNKLMEYLAAGVPVVTSDIGRIGSVVQETNSGLVGSPGDPFSHAAAILQLLGDADLWNMCARNGRRAYRERFDWESEQHILVNLYKQLLG